MKKFIALLIVAALAVCLVACAAANKNEEKEEANTTVFDIDAFLDALPDEDPEETTAPSEPKSETKASVTETPETEAPKTEAPKTEAPKDENIGGIRKEFKEAMDAYEEFYDEYCELMKKYMANPTDMTLLAEYMEFLENATEVDKKFEEWNGKDMNDAETKYYLEVLNRVSKKLMEVAQ